MRIEWDPDLETGVEIIDEQHRELFVRMDALVQAMKEGRGCEQIGSILSFLENYVDLHFRTEEKFMVRHGYESTAEHVREHAKFRNDFTQFKKASPLDGMDSAVTIEVFHRLVSWIRDHIRVTDKAMGKYFKALEDAGA